MRKYGWWEESEINKREKAKMKKNREKKRERVTLKCWKDGVWDQLLRHVSRLDESTYTYDIYIYR
jgi:hypothetical protein